MARRKIQRKISIVKKPLRQPTVKARAAAPRKASKPAARKPAAFKSVVKKPAKTLSRAVVARRAAAPRPARPKTARVRAKTAAPTAQSQAPLKPAVLPQGPVIAAAAPAVKAASWEEPSFAIPMGYGDNQIVLMVKDPWWLYAYWEVQPSVERQARAQLLPQEAAGLQSVLRVYDVTGRNYPDEPANRTFDIGLSGMATNWYIQTDAPGCAFIVEIGLLTNTGRFLLLARSNRVIAPRFGPSDVIDEQWMATDEDYWRLFGAAGGLGAGSSQAGSAHLMPQTFFSGNWSSGSLYGFSKPSAVRGFWCRVNTDLVIHGAAEPRSTVKIQGQPVMLRKDGTFSTRLALPAGVQRIAIEVISPDGAKNRIFMPEVTMAWAGPLGPGEGIAGAPPKPEHPELL